MSCARQKARREKPRVSAFTSANLDKITALRPDLVLTFSDLSADIRDLIRRGLNLHVFNQRSVAGILDMIRTVGAMVGASEVSGSGCGAWEGWLDQEPIDPATDEPLLHPAIPQATDDFGEFERPIVAFAVVVVGFATDVESFREIA
jgi:Periplasmic binding protein